MIKIKFKNDDNKIVSKNDYCDFENLIKKEFICKDSRIDYILYPKTMNEYYANEKTEFSKDTVQTNRR